MIWNLKQVTSACESQCDIACQCLYSTAICQYHNMFFALMILANKFAVEIRHTFVSSLITPA